MTILKNRKAQAGIALTFPILLIIIVIMAFFIILSTAITSLKQPSSLKASGVITANHPFLKTISINGEELLAIDSYILSQNKEQIHESLKSSLSEGNDCYLLFDEFDIIKGYRLDTLGEIIPIVDDKDYKANKITYEMDERETFIKYYYGPCP